MIMPPQVEAPGRGRISDQVLLRSFVSTRRSNSRKDRRSRARQHRVRGDASGL